ncbi:MAG TPA: VOC family protein [Polyangia bacterium]|nr:VOC family protein [Polyangia bacterium]
MHHPRPTAGAGNTPAWPSAKRDARARDDVEKTYAELKERGVEFVAPPRREPWGMRALFKDSEGNGFVMSAK